MKSTTKKIVIWALILMGIGAVFMAAALAGGARFKDLKYFNYTINGNRRFRDNLFNIIYDLNAILSDDVWDEDFDDILDAKEDLRAAREELSDEYDELKEAFDELNGELKSLPVAFTNSYEGKNVSAIEIDVSAARIDIKTGTTFSVTVRQGRHRNVYSSLKNGVLEIDEKGGFNWKRKRKKPDTAYIDVTIPENTVLDELDIAVNAGALSLHHRSLTANELSVELNAGSVSIRDVTSLHTDIDCNAGVVRIDGRLRGKTEADCNAGKIDLTIDSGGEDYSWDAKAALGNIRVNDSVSSGLANLNSSGSTRINHLDLSAAVGSIDVSIQ
ncbi:DUF4097 family beta strand repeat protein [Treponema sp. OMZ 840]|uniref:DUF4097 family beta strand repeat-containing protein n=1 Tax=Treponema sp. OMZ 840 TaxID=244313 RepID=UPI003D8D3960